MNVADRVAELAAEAVDPDRSDLLRALSAEEVTHRLTYDNRDAPAEAIAQAAAEAITRAREARP